MCNGAVKGSGKEGVVRRCCRGVCREEGRKERKERQRGNKGGEAAERWRGRDQRGRERVVRSGGEQRWRGEMGSEREGSRERGTVCSGCMWVQGSTERERREYLLGSFLAALSEGEDKEVLWNTKVGAGVEVRASPMSLRASGGAEEGDEAEDGVWGVLHADVWFGRMCCCDWGREMAAASRVEARA